MARVGSGVDELADLGPDLAGLLPGLRGQLRDRGGQLVLERLKSGLDEVHGRLGQVVDVLEPLGDAVAHPVDPLVQRDVLGEAGLQFDPLHLGPLVTQHAEADGDVRRVPGQVRDTLGEDGDVGGYVRHGSLLSGRFAPRSRSQRPAGQTSAFTYKSITFVKQ